MVYKMVRTSKKAKTALLVPLEEFFFGFKDEPIVQNIFLLKTDFRKI